MSFMLFLLNNNDDDNGNESRQIVEFLLYPFVSNPDYSKEEKKEERISDGRRRQYGVIRETKRSGECKRDEHYYEKKTGQARAILRSHIN